VVEHDLAKVGVEGSSPFARSKIFLIWQSLKKVRREAGLYLLALRGRRFRPRLDTLQNVLEFFCRHTTSLA
jgi:hypothetical protein